MKKRAGLLASLAVSTLFMAGGIVAAQEPSQSPAHADKQPGRRASRGDDIAVHGHWMIEVRNPDGTLASHNEFENALLGSGQSALSTLLGKTATVLEWRLVLNGATQPCSFATLPVPCQILENTQIVFALFQQSQFATLVITPTQGGTLELQGNFTAPVAGSIDDVTSSLATSSGVLPFSQRVLATPIAVVAGQQVYVKVTFSFS